MLIFQIILSICVYIYVCWYSSCNLSDCFRCRDEFVDLDAKFSPSIINTTVYIISMAMQVSTFAVNYKVREQVIILPWQASAAQTLGVDS